MPATTGPISVNNISSGGVVHYGDCTQIAPKSLQKSYAGHGSFGIGDGHLHFHLNSSPSTTISDPDTLDSAFLVDD
ncbi:MAG TPA: spore germination protein [Bacillales bacterium]|nr:spore germination protein [Bacillales bacterium]